jgi:hypothetical protein
VLRKLFRPITKFCGHQTGEQAEHWITAYSDCEPKKVQDIFFTNKWLQVRGKNLSIETCAKMYTYYFHQSTYVYVRRRVLNAWSMHSWFESLIMRSIDKCCWWYFACSII